MGGGQSAQKLKGLSADDERRRAAVEAKSRQDTVEDAKIIKILLLGAGECGKSTILKQMKILHCDGFNDGEVKHYRKLILTNVLESIHTLCQAMVDLPNPPRYDCKKNEQDANDILQLSDDYVPVKEDGPRIKALWSDNGIQDILLRSREFHLLDSAPYFLKSINLDRILERDYIPTQDDILRCRLATTGIHQTKFSLENLKFRMFDVGGQRGERKKWIHCFENVTAIMYIASLIEFDQVLAEDRTRNRMEESLALFTGIVNLPWFKAASIILFLNKYDLFQEKVERVKISEFFPDYAKEGYKDGDKRDGTKFIQNLYVEKNNDQDKKTYVHITDATNTENIKFVWKAVRHMILEKNLNQSGLSCGF